MKSIINIFFILSFFILNSYCCADQYDDAMKKILAEKNIIYGSWGPIKGSSLYIAVQDDGSKQDGFAAYLCLILNDYKIKGVVIHIMTPENFKKLNTNEDLGRFICE